MLMNKSDRIIDVSKISEDDVNDEHTKCVSVDTNAWGGDNLLLGILVVLWSVLYIFFFNNCRPNLSMNSSPGRTCLRCREF